MEDRRETGYLCDPVAEPACQGGWNIGAEFKICDEQTVKVGEERP